MLLYFNWCINYHPPYNNYHLYKRFKNNHLGIIDKLQNNVIIILIIKMALLTYLGIFELLIF